MTFTPACAPVKPDRCVIFEKSINGGDRPSQMIIVNGLCAHFRGVWRLRTRRDTECSIPDRKEGWAGGLRVPRKGTDRPRGRPGGRDVDVDGRDPRCRRNCPSIEVADAMPFRVIRGDRRGRVVDSFRNADRSP